MELAHLAVDSIVGIIVAWLVWKVLAKLDDLTTIKIKGDFCFDDLLERKPHKKKLFDLIINKEGKAGK